MRSAPKSGVAAFAVLCLCLVPTTRTFAAGPGQPRFRAVQGDAETDVSGLLRASASSIDHTSPRNGAQERGTPVLETLLVPACPGNAPTSQDPAGGLCAAATQYCAAAGQQGVSFWLFTRPAGQAAGWQLASQQCLTGQQAAAAAAAPVVTGDDFRRLPLPPGVVHVQPGNGRTLVNVPTNVYLDAETRIIPTVVLGLPVRVRAIPISYRWSFGDGTDLRTTDPGAPYPDLRTTHVYSAAGAVRIGLTTTYRGEYSVAGGAWLPIDGTADVTTPPALVTVLEARDELVSSPLPS